MARNSEKKAARTATSASDSRRADTRLKDYVQHIPFLACLTEDELAELQAVVDERKLARDEVLLWEEDTSRYFYIVYSGKVKAVKVSSEGGEHILAIHGQKDFFGEVGILDGKTSPATVIAMEPSHVGIITRGHFEKHLLSKPKVLRELLFVFCSRLRESWLKLKVLSFNDAESRVRAVLELMAQQGGMTVQERRIVLPNLTHKDIAGFASLSRETVSRQVRKLSLANEIEILDNRQIVLNPTFRKNSQIL